MSSFASSRQPGAHKVLLGLVCGSLLTGLLIVSGQSSNAQPATETLPRGVVARVGNRLIEAESVLARINEYERTQDIAHQHLRQAYTYLINLELLRAEAERLNIVVTPEERKEVADAQIEAAKQALRSRHAGQVTWETFLQGMNMTPKEFEEHVLERAEQILLKRRLIWYWEWSTPSVGFTQIVLRNMIEATTVHQKAVARIEEAKILARAGGGKSDPAPAGGDDPVRLFEPEGREEADKAVREALWELAYLETRSRSEMTPELWDGMPLREDVREIVFKKLKVGELSDPVRLNDETVAIYFINSRSPGAKQSYLELKDRLDAMPDPTEKQYERWIQAVLHSSRHKVEFRIPGEKPAAAPKPAESGEGTADKPTE